MAADDDDHDDEDRGAEPDADSAAGYEMAARQQGVSEDLDLVEEYGRRFPDTWAGAMFDDDRVVALFTDPAPHQQAIAQLVSHPDRVDVRVARRSEGELERVMAGVERYLHVSDGDWVSYGPDTGNAVVVELRGRAAALARQLHEQYGPAVQITLGAQPYPTPTRREPAHLTPAPAPAAQGQIAGVSVRAVPDSTVVSAGDDITGHVVITNHRDNDLSAHTGAPLCGDLLRDQHIVGQGNGPETAMAQLLLLPPGCSRTVEFTAGTDSRDPEHGPVLQPGRYDLVVSVGLFEVNDCQEDGALLVTNPVPVDISASSRTDST